MIVFNREYLITFIIIDLYADSTRNTDDAKFYNVKITASDMFQALKIFQKNNKPKKGESLEIYQINLLSQ